MHKLCPHQNQHCFSESQFYLESVHIKLILDKLSLMLNYFIDFSVYCICVEPSSLFLCSDGSAQLAASLEFTADVLILPHFIDQNDKSVTNQVTSWKS